MTVYLTNQLAGQLRSVGIEPHDFAEWFKLWKDARDELDSAMFGRDGGYVAPTVQGEKYRLRHVHLVPLLDRGAHDRWYRNYAAGRSRTSDRVLVYVRAANGDYLLISILDEPEAHEIARMQTTLDKGIMRGFATVAEEFLTDGAIIV